jgi:hypothetical protein
VRSEEKDEREYDNPSFQAGELGRVFFESLTLK